MFEINSQFNLSDSNLDVISGKGFVGTSAEILHNIPGPDATSTIGQLALKGPVESSLNNLGFHINHLSNETNTSFVNVDQNFIQLKDFVNDLYAYISGLTISSSCVGSLSNVSDPLPVAPLILGISEV